MIKLTVREAAEKRGINSPADLAKAMGHRSRTIAGRLWRGEKVQLRALDDAAGALDCDLCELVRRVPDAHTRSAPRRQRTIKKGGRKRRAK